MKKKRKRKLRRSILYTGIFLLTFTAGIAFLVLVPYIRFTDRNPVLERMNEYHASDFIARANGEVTAEDDVLFTEETGEYHTRFTVKKWIFNREYDLVYRVEDTTPPEISFQESVIYRNPEEDYSTEEMKENITLSEAGTVQVETDYNPLYSGYYTVKATAEDAYGNVSEASFEAVVKDEEPPVVFRTGNNTRILKGEDFVLSDIISYGDNADPAPSLSVTGEVDTSQTGSYPIHAVLTDFFGNVKEWDLTVEVVDEIPKTESEHHSYPFSELRKEFAGEGRRFGIDVSFWQGDIDFEAVKEAGCEFVILRIGYSHNGELKTDEQFHAYLEGAKNAGLPIGIYLFVYDNTEEELRSSLDQMFAELGDTRLDLPVAFDWENFSNYQDYEISFQQLNHLYDIFETEVQQHGYESMLYGSKTYLESVWTHTDTRPVWLAQYYNRVTYESPYMIWQCSGSGRIDGISGDVDLDILYGS